MLFLDQIRTVPGATVTSGTRDDGRRCWYALPESPRLAHDGTTPRLSYTLFAPPLGSAAAPRGWLSLALDLRGSNEERAGWAAAAGITVEDLAPFPATTVSLSLEQGGVALVQVPASPVGADLRLGASLEGDDAVLLWAALSAARPTLVARAVVTFPYQLAATRVRVWAEREGRTPLGQPDAELRALLSSGRAGVVIEPGAPLPPEIASVIDTRAHAVLAAACAGSPGSFSFELSLHEVHTGTLALGGVLAPEWPDPAAHLHRVELDDTIARPITVGVVCPAFDSAVLSAIQLRLRHPADGAARTVRDVMFGVEGGDWLYAAVATREEADDVAVETSLWLRDEQAPWRRPEQRLRSGAALVLDPDRCGVIRVEVSASAAPWGAWQHAEVNLSAEPGQTGRLLLSPTTLSKVWESVARTETPPTVTMTTRWMSTDGHWSEPLTREVAAGRWFIAPPEPPPPARVEVLAAGDWTALQRIVVELAGPGEEMARHDHTFTAPDERHVWEDAVIPYRARFTVVSDSGAAVGGWEDHDDLLLVVIDREQHAVEVVPDLLLLGEHIRLARVEVEDRSATHDPPSHAAFTFTSPTSIVWRYRAGGPSPVYRWRLTLIGTDGSRVETDWRDGRGEVLVLTPPT